MRKFTLTAFECLMKISNNELYRYKHVIKVAIGVCKLSLQLNKSIAQETEKLTPLFEEYKKS